MSGSIEIRDVETDDLYFKGEIVQRENPGGINIIAFDYGVNPTVRVVIEA